MQTLAAMTSNPNCCRTDIDLPRAVMLDDESRMRGEVCTRQEDDN
jgi:hypothetical protein